MKYKEQSQVFVEQGLCCNFVESGLLELSEISNIVNKQLTTTKSFIVIITSSMLVEQEWRQWGTINNKSTT